jgi:hypothetical protein
MTEITGLYADLTQLKQHVFSLEMDQMHPMHPMYPMHPMETEDTKDVEPGTPQSHAASIPPSFQRSMQPTEDSQMHWRRLFRQLFKTVRTDLSTPWNDFLQHMGATYEQRSELERLLTICRIPFHSKRVMQIVPRTVLYHNEHVPMTAALRQLMVESVRQQGQASADQVLLATICIRLISFGFDVQMPDLRDWLQPEFDVRGDYVVNWSLCK